jgi:hypothetical protein
MSYHTSGLVSAILTTLALSGLVTQLVLIWQRKRLTNAGELLNERPTAVLSVNRFITSFLAYYSFLVFGSIQRPFNHYLVWPRIGAVTLTLAVLFELMIDRRQKRVIGAFAFCAVLTTTGLLLVIFRPPITPLGETASKLLVCLVTLMYVQGGIAQLQTIRRTGHTGGLSIALHMLFLAKDTGTALFAIAIGMHKGWPVLLLSTAGMAIQAATLWHFRWAQTSPKARRRRSGLTVAT